MEVIILSAAAAYVVCGILTCTYHLTKINESMSDYERTRLKDRKNEAIWAAQHHWDALKGSWLWPIGSLISAYKAVKWVISLGGM
jgi:hypothetical protein